MMEGPKAAKQFVTEYLASDLPTRLQVFRNTQNLDTHRLPDPAKYIGWEPLNLDHWPYVITIVLGTADVLRDDMDDSFNPIYRVRYNMRTYAWVKASGEKLATDMRDDLITVIRTALIDHPSLRSFDPKCLLNSQVDESTIREEFSDLTPLTGENIMAGGYVSYDLYINESVTRDDYGIFQNWTLMVDRIEGLPNAPTYLRVVAGSGAIALSWHASTWDGGVHPITGYKIEQSTDAGDTWATVVADTATTVPQWGLTGLSSSETYIFRVAAINLEGVGSTSTSSIPTSPL